MRWIFSQVEPTAEIVEFANNLELPFAIAQLLWKRGLQTVEAAQAYLDPKLRTLSDPFLLPNMEQAVTRIFKAIDSNERVVLYGDYDVDGVTSLALLSKVLKGFGLEAPCFLPVRDDEGYGLSIDGLKRCISESRPCLVIAVDCGTSAVSEIDWLKRQGIEVIVLDHHECADRLPDCIALVNPKLSSDFHYLCSVGIVFKLGHALLKRKRLPDFDLSETLDLVALGTLADLVPLRDENRILVKKGLLQLARTKWVGVRALMDVSGVRPPVQAADVGFKLGPRINAAGRLGTAVDALNLMLTQDFAHSMELANELDLINQERRNIEDRVFEEALRQAAELHGRNPEDAIVVGAMGWHSGVLGIVASKLMRRYHRPTFVVSLDENGGGRGSGRSIRGLSLVEALSAASEFLDKFGGHEMAAGISIKPGHFENFRKAFNLFTKSAVTREQLEPLLEIDGELQLKEINTRTLEKYEALSPFGMGNPQPVFVVRSVTPSASPRVLREKHVQLSLRQDGVQQKAIWFNAAAETLPPAPWDVAFELTRNEYQGTVSPQMVVRAVRPASGA